MDNSKSAIVTGARGFIGSALVKELRSSGYEVYAVTHKRCSNVDDDRIHFFACDFGEYHNLPDSLGDASVDCFFHFAWKGVSGRLYADLETQMENVRGALAALTAASELGCKRFIGAGSIHELEAIEQMECSLSEGIAPAPYKTAKLCANYLCSRRAMDLGIDFFWPRITNAYGWGELSSRLVISTVKSLLLGERCSFTDATQEYDFVYVEDVARAFIAIAEKGIPEHRYVVGSGDPRQLKDYLYWIGKIVNPDIELGIGDLGDSGIHLKRESLVTDSLREDTGFEPLISFDEGISRTKAWVLQSNL